MSLLPHPLAWHTDQTVHFEENRFRSSPRTILRPTSELLG